MQEVFFRINVDAHKKRDGKSVFENTSFSNMNKKGNSVMKKIKISVIVPIFNMEEYILQALDSIENQILEEKEIICIDDGSMDSSYEVLTNYAKEHQNVIVFQQNNAGAGAARNLGIRKAKGEFVCFMDIDDFYYSEDALEYLYHLAKQQDVNICGGSSCNYQYGKITTIGIRKERQFDKEYFVYCEDYPGFTGYWAFIYKREFLINNNIFFPLYLRGQDEPFFIKAIAYAGGVYCSDKIIYVYRCGHKKVVYDLEKALGIAKSSFDVLAIAVQFKMKEVYFSIFNEFQGEIGALVCRLAFEGNQEMLQIIEDINMLCDTSKNVFFLKHGKCLPEGNELIQYVQNNKIVEKEFREKLSSIEKIYIFGAGNIGKKVLIYLQKHNIHIDSIIVSNIEQNISQLENVPIKGVDEIKLETDNYIIILAVWWHSRDAVVNALKEKGFYNIYPIDLRRFFLWQDVIEH